MICPSCNTRNNYYHRYCHFCGAKLNNEEVMEDKLPDSLDGIEALHEDILVTLDPDPSPDPESKYSPVKMLTLTLIVLLLAATMIGLMLFMNRPKANPYKGTTPSPSPIKTEEPAALEKAPLKLLSPTSPMEETLEESYTLQIKSIPGTGIFLNDEDITSHMDEDGLIHIDVPIEAEGDNVFIIRAERENMAPHEIRAVLHKPPMEIPITIHNLPPYESEDALYTIAGTTEPGANITANLPTEGPVTVDEETGDFEIKVKLTNDPGDNPVILTASKEGKKDSTLLLHVEKILSEAQYLERAIPLDYDKLAEDPHGHSDKILDFTGKVTEILRGEDPPLFLLDIGTPPESRILMVEYLGDTAIETDRRYKLIGQPAGEQDGHIFIRARLAYKYR